MKTFLASILTLLVSTQTFAGGAVVSGGRISALADSKFRIRAALDAVNDFSLVISAVEVLENGSVKVSLVSRDQQCRAVIFEINQSGGQTGAAQYTAVNPQRAHCN